MRKTWGIYIFSLCAGVWLKGELHLHSNHTWADTAFFSFNFTDDI